MATSKNGKQAAKPINTKPIVPEQPASGEQTEPTVPEQHASGEQTEPTVSEQPATGEQTEPTGNDAAGAVDATGDNGSADNSELHEAMKPYLSEYTGEKLFYVATDGQVFLSSGRLDAEAHQKFVDNNKKLREYAV